MTALSKAVGRSYELLALLDVCATTADSKEQEAALEWFSNSQRRWRANCTTNGRCSKDGSNSTRW